MADVRINAKTVTTTIAADDYLALDGATNGTRAILGTVVPAAYNLGTASDASFSTLAATAATASLTLGAATETAVLAVDADGALTITPKTKTTHVGPLALTYLAAGTGTDIGMFATSGGGLFVNAPTTKSIRIGFANSERVTIDENATAIVGNLTASGTGSHVFGTTNTVTLAEGALVCTAGFGCNTKAAQTAYASGGALAAYGAGANGFDSGANASALHAMVVSIRAALVANGIMS